MFVKRTLAGLWSATPSVMPDARTSPSEKRNIIGERLREARRLVNPPLTQDQLSGKLAAIGVQLDRVAITKVENGQRCVFDFELRALAETLRVDVEWLLGMDRGTKRKGRRGNAI